MDGYRTVNVDEASTVAKEQLATVIDAVEAVTRLILVGDPRQLPPSGRGQPFVVIVTGLEPINIEATFRESGRNRFIQRFPPRGDARVGETSRFRKIPKPFGPEEVGQG